MPFRPSLNALPAAFYEVRGSLARTAIIGVPHRNRGRRYIIGSVGVGVDRASYYDTGQAAGFGNFCQFD